MLCHLRENPTAFGVHMCSIFMMHHGSSGSLEYFDLEKHPPGLLRMHSWIGCADWQLVGTMSEMEFSFMFSHCLFFRPSHFEFLLQTNSSLARYRYLHDKLYIWHSNYWSYLWWGIIKDPSEWVMCQPHALKLHYMWGSANI